MTTNRTTVDITPAGMDIERALVYAKSLIGKPYTDNTGRLIGEIRNVKSVDGKILAEIKLQKNVILG